MRRMAVCPSCEPAVVPYWPHATVLLEVSEIVFLAARTQAADDYDGVDL
jgi:hypothetical protein